MELQRRIAEGTGEFLLFALTPPRLTTEPEHARQIVAKTLERLRPVSFHLKTDPMGTLQYGLIAEEVERVYPELVIRDAEGQIQGVRYDELAPLLLSEVQRQRGQMAAEHEKAEAEGQIIKAQADQLVELGARMSELTRQMAEIRQLNESTQAASIIFPLNSDRVATRPHRSVE